MRGMVLGMLAALVLVPAGAFAAEGELQIGPGSYEIKGRLEAAKKIIVAPGTTITVRGNSGVMKAPVIEWKGNVQIQLDGSPGADGTDAPPGWRRVWCMAEDHKNWEQEWQNASPEAGLSGGDGQSGTKGKNLDIEARSQIVSSGARIRISALGGRGGRGGKGGLGARFSRKPSGDDCDHGTREQANKEGAAGGSGKNGTNGTNGVVKFVSSTYVDPDAVEMTGGTLMWIVPEAAAK